MTENRKQDFERLKAVTEVAWAAASQGLRRQAALERAASAKLQDLAQARRRSLDGLVAADQSDTAMISAASGWMIWAERERERLNMELARARAALAGEQAKARKAFSKREAAKKLQEIDKERRRRRLAE
ncbi:hypothetical protein SAMN04488094_107148 [Tropicimonas isoalkanivorans]|uniref:Uncharacterized protein n=2 Tax=Tropicimonas isoalkanivorans TaxID=441112 RepID=A0A1I1L516_9RHOB|nr:hypothetical protein SAMN04488094_107148 [Tropicimonas isoalkanivorans]